MASLSNKFEIVVIYVVTDPVKFKESDRTPNIPQQVPGFGDVHLVKHKSHVEMLKKIKFYKAGIPFGIPQNHFAIADAMKNKALDV